MAHFSDTTGPLKHVTFRYSVLLLWMSEAFLISAICKSSDLHRFHTDAASSPSQEKLKLHWKNTSLTVRTPFSLFILTLLSRDIYILTDNFRSSCRC